MSKYGKWIGGGLGWAFGGPIGAILGFAIGSYLDRVSDLQYRGTPPYGRASRTRTGDFGVSLLILAGAVMKADGKVLQSELEYIKKFFINQFGAANTQEKMLLFREMLKQDIDVKKVCLQIRDNMNYHSRLQLIHFLFGVSRADGHVHTKEVLLIEQITNYLGINSSDFLSIKAMFYKDANAAYSILEITSNASNGEVKKAYRKMALKYHPDKLAHLGKDFQKAAKEKFLKVAEAYGTIKKERGMN